MKVPYGLKRTAVICVLKSDRRFLLLKRLKEPNKDLYTPVGGKLDPFENPFRLPCERRWKKRVLRLKL